MLLLNPFGVVPGRAATTGAWGDPDRIEAVARISGPLLVEDSGLLVANGRQPAVDDIFLWSRNRAREVNDHFIFPPGDQLIAAVRAGRFDAVVTEVDLASLDVVGGFERQRWHPDLVAAVLERYVLRAIHTPPASEPSLSTVAGASAAPLFVYTRR